MKKTTNHLIIAACLSFLSLPVSAATYNISGDLTFLNAHNAGPGNFNVNLITSGDLPDEAGASVSITGISGRFFGIDIKGLSPFNSANQLLYNTPERFDIHGVSFELKSTLFTDKFGFNGNFASLFYSAGTHLFVGALEEGSYAAIGTFPVINSETGYVLSRYKVSSVTAVPEPETYAMFLAGLGLLGFVSRKKKVN